MSIASRPINYFSCLVCMLNFCKKSLSWCIAAAGSTTQETGFCQTFTQTIEVKSTGITLGKMFYCVQGTPSLVAKTSTYLVYNISPSAIRNKVIRTTRKWELQKVAAISVIKFVTGWWLCERLTDYLTMISMGWLSSWLINQNLLVLVICIFTSPYTPKGWYLFGYNKVWKKIVVTLRQLMTTDWLSYWKTSQLMEWLTCWWTDWLTGLNVSLVAD